MTTYYYAGGSYEVQTDGTTETLKQYYSIAGMTVAVRAGDDWSYFLTDHLGSIVAVTDESGTLTSETRYLPFGEIRSDVGAISEIDFGYTFQRNLPDTGLMDYKARAYDPWLGRFVQPDTIVPGAANPQAWNRFSYVENNPINAIDPSGHNRCSSIPDSRARKECDKYALEVISIQGFEFIRFAEGGNQSMYDDGGQDGLGNCTIGIGNLLHSGPCNGSEVHQWIIDGVPGSYIYSKGKPWLLQLWGRDYKNNPIWGLSKLNANMLMQIKLKINSTIIQSKLEVQLTQNQWDAVQSYVFNTGNIDIITMALNKGGNFSAVRELLLDESSFITIDGQYNRGIEIRRNEEWDLFKNGDYDWQLSIPVRVIN